MNRTMNHRQLSFRQAGIMLILILAAATIATSAPPVRAAEDNEQRGFGYTTGVVGIVPGQRAQLTVWNKGKDPVLARLQFVDDKGKVLLQCDAIIQPGKSAVETFTITFGGSRVEFQAQFGTNERRSIGLLVPTVQIIDGTSNATSWMIGQEGFAEIRPIWVPSLVPPL